MGSLSPTGWSHSKHYIVYPMIYKPKDNEKSWKHDGETHFCKPMLFFLNFWWCLGPSRLQTRESKINSTGTGEDGWSLARWRYISFFLDSHCYYQSWWWQVFQLFSLPRYLPHLVYLFTPLWWVPSVSAVTFKLGYPYFQGPLVKQYSDMPGSIYSDR